MRAVYPWSSLVVVLLLLVFTEGVSGAPVGTALSFNRDVRPILSDNCFQCHGPDRNTRKGGLRLDVREEAMAERDGARAIVPGQPAESELVRRITHADVEERMPPMDSGRSLSVKERQVLEEWINQGARYEAHWAFTPPRRPPLPAVADEGWPRNGIDHFILARLEKAGLQPSPGARRERLLRRLTFDLTGLPPSPEELDAFLADDSPGAVARVVDRLLASGRYGEQMAVSWLDAARYADTNGYNNDTPRYNWRWRDWVIAAFNRNLSYDRFVIEQLGGDLIPEASLDQRLATGFNRNHNVTSEGGIIDEEYRLEYVADRVHTTATVFMALSLQCARCHDHKFDPISQKEYYEFFAFFNQVPETGYHHEHVGNPKPVMPAPTAQQSAALEGLETELASIAAQIAGWEREAARELPGWDAGPRAKGKGGGETSEGLLKQLRGIYLGLSGRGFVGLEQLRVRRARERRELLEARPTAMVMRDQAERRETFMLRRGDYDKPGEKVEAGVPAVFPSFPAGVARDRLSLGRWLADPAHPLTARVMVNRLWHQMFGVGLVDTLEDFGSQGAWPSHPELLDWLAVEFAGSGWDMKAMLKLIATSATYQQSARVTPELLRVDPDNRLLARGPRFRLGAEMIRDQALAVSGLLEERIGGPSVKPYQPPGLWAEVIVADDSYSGGDYRQDHGVDLYRRGVYTWWKRTCPPPSLSTFDAPDREFCSVRRTPTNTPLQALVLLNDPTFVEAARGLAERVMREGGATTEARARYAFRLATSRMPVSEELAVLLRAHEQQRARFGPAPEQAALLVGVGESRPDPGLDPVELAAWTALCGMVLNLDEAITR